MARHLARQVPTICLNLRRRIMSFRVRDAYIEKLSGGAIMFARLFFEGDSFAPSSRKRQTERELTGREQPSVDDTSAGAILSLRRRRPRRRRENCGRLDSDSDSDSARSLARSLIHSPRTVKLIIVENTVCARSFSSLVRPAV